MVTIALWWRHPGFRLLVPYAIGIALSKYLILPSILVLVSGLICIGISSISALRSSVPLKPLIGSLFMLAILVMGVVFGYEAKKIPHHIPSGNQSICLVSDMPVETAKSVRARVDVFSHLAGEHLGSAILYLKKCPQSETIKAGDILSFIGEWEYFEKPKNPGQFDIASFYSAQNIDWRGFADSTEFLRIGSKRQRGILAHMSEWRQKAIGQWKNHGLDGEAGAVAGAMVLGDKSELPREVMDSFARAGVIHVLCVSGMHAGIIFMMVSFAIGYLGIRSSRSYARILIPSVAVWFYAVLTGLSPSVVRAAVLITITMASASMGRKSERAGMLAMAAFLILLMEPQMLLKTGFQLSFLAVLGIIMISKVGRLPISNPWLGWLIENLQVSLAAQALTTPLSMMLFHRFPTYFLISNILIVPLATLALWLCLGTMAISFLKPLASIIAWCASKVIEGMLWLVAQIGHLPASSIDQININPSALLIGYGLIFSVWAWLSFRDARIIKYCLILALTLSIMSLHKLWIRDHHQEICFYSLGPYPAVDIFVGKEVYSMSSVPEEKWEYLFKSSIEPFRSINGAKKEYCLGPPVSKGMYRLQQIGNVMVGVARYPDDWLSKLTLLVDSGMIVIGGSRVPDTLEVLGAPDFLVLCDSYKLPFVKCDAQVNVHYLKNGAFRLDFQQMDGQIGISSF